MNIFELIGKTVVGSVGVFIFLFGLSWALTDGAHQQAQAITRFDKFDGAVKSLCLAIVSVALGGFLLWVSR